jgi:hypothetical protein
MGGMNPQMMGAMAAMVSAMTPAQRAQFAQQAGIPVEELNMIAAMGGGMGGGMGGSGGGAPGGLPPGATVVHLTEAERAAVDRVRYIEGYRGKRKEADHGVRREMWYSTRGCGARSLATQPPWLLR